MVLAGCSGRSDQAVPRPKAMPRIEIPQPQYRDTLISGLHLQLSKAATVASDSSAREGHEWLNITYPSLYGKPVIYLTLTQVSGDAERSRVLDNRAERMALNSGGNRSELTELESAGGFHCQMLFTPRGTVTPVQILAVGGDHVVSGTLFIDGLNNPAEADRYAPVISAVQTDMLQLLQQIR